MTASSARISRSTPPDCHAVVGRPIIVATASSFDIIDTQGNKYAAVPLDANLNPFAWIARPLRPSRTEPDPSSIAAFGPTQGTELLFKINTSAYSNRPLTLEIRGPSQQVQATVSLDL